MDIQEQIIEWGFEQYEKQFEGDDSMYLTDSEKGLLKSFSQYCMTTFQQSLIKHIGQQEKETFTKSEVQELIKNIKINPPE